MCWPRASASELICIAHPTFPVTHVAAPLGALLSSLRTAGHVGGDVVRLDAVPREESVDVVQGEFLGAVVLSVVVMDCAAASLRPRDEDLRATRRQQLDRHAIDTLEHHAADAPREERDGW